MNSHGLSVVLALTSALAACVPEVTADPNEVSTGESDVATADEGTESNDSLSEESTPRKGRKEVV